MKKKNFHSRLNLKKHKISNLQQNALQGGTDAVTFVIITTVKVLTEYITRRICPTDTNTLSVDTECP